MRDDLIRPTKDRMRQLWAEMERWTVAETMSFAVCLAHKCMDDCGLRGIDAGFFDSKAATEVYLVAARGAAAAQLRSIACQLVEESGALRGVIKVGESPTPFSPDEEREI